MNKSNRKRKRIQVRYADSSEDDDDEVDSEDVQKLQTKRKNETEIRSSHESNVNSCDSSVSESDTKKPNNSELCMEKQTVAFESIATAGNGVKEVELMSDNSDGWSDFELSKIPTSKVVRKKKLAQGKKITNNKNASSPNEDVAESELVLPNVNTDVHTVGCCTSDTMENLMRTVSIEKLTEIKQSSQVKYDSNSKMSGTCCYLIILLKKEDIMNVPPRDVLQYLENNADNESLMVEWYIGKNSHYQPSLYHTDKDFAYQSSIGQRLMDDKRAFCVHLWKFPQSLSTERDFNYEYLETLIIMYGAERNKVRDVGAKFKMININFPHRVCAISHKFPVEVCKSIILLARTTPLFCFEKSTHPHSNSSIQLPTFGNQTFSAQLHLQASKIYELKLQSDVRIRNSNQQHEETIIFFPYASDLHENEKPWLLNDIKQDQQDYINKIANGIVVNGLKCLKTLRQRSCYLLLILDKESGKGVTQKSLKDFLHVNRNNNKLLIRWYVGKCCKGNVSRYHFADGGGYEGPVKKILLKGDKVFKVKLWNFMQQPIKPEPYEAFESLILEYGFVNNNITTNGIKFQMINVKPEESTFQKCFTAEDLFKIQIIGQTCRLLCFEDCLDSNERPNIEDDLTAIDGQIFYGNIHLKIDDVKEMFITKKTPIGNKGLLNRNNFTNEKLQDIKKMKMLNSNGNETYNINDTRNNHTPVNDHTLHNYEPQRKSQSVVHKYAVHTPAIYKCSYHQCTASFSKLDDLSIHQQNHTSIRLYQLLQCSHCGLTCKDRSEFIIHVKEHKEKYKRHPCDQCGMRYFRESDLLAHLKCHSDVHLYHCSKCPKTFKQLSSLSTHRRFYHNKCESKCNICGKSFRRPDILKEHIKEKHIGERPYKCDVCSKSFYRKRYLESHMSVHIADRTFECEICGKLYKNKVTLYAHVKKHSQERRFQCSMCNYSCNVKEHLTNHINGVHKEETNFECTLCEKKFKTKPSLSQHFQTHRSDRPYKCTKCSKGFKTKSNLSSHQHSHAEGRSFSCEICSIKFITSNTLRGHKKSKGHIRKQKDSLMKKDKQQGNSNVP